MKRSLSVVLPVYNAERTLNDSLQHIFDILSDLTERFEVLVVDDGSTDQTMEVAHELAVMYPQLRVARPVEPRGHDGNLEQASGDVVLLHGSRGPFSPNDARRLWELCDREECRSAADVRRIDAPNGPGRSTLTEGRAPRPLAFLGRNTPQIGSITMLRHPG